MPVDDPRLDPLWAMAAKTDTVVIVHVADPIAFFDPLDDEQLARLEEQVDWILQEVGIAFRDDPEAIALWKREGARVEDDIVRAPADWIRELLEARNRELAAPTAQPEGLYFVGARFPPEYGLPEQAPAFPRGQGLS